MVRPLPTLDPATTYMRKHFPCSNFQHDTKNESNNCIQVTSDTEDSCISSAQDCNGEYIFGRFCAEGSWGEEVVGAAFLLPNKSKAGWQTVLLCGFLDSKAWPLRCSAKVSNWPMLMG